MISTRPFTAGPVIVATAARLVNAMQSTKFHWARVTRTIAWLGSIFFLSGCDVSSRPSVTPPKVNPGSTAAAAIRSYDSDGNGSLSNSELTACPAISSARKLYDRDGDGQLSQEEIAARLEQLFGSSVGLVTVDCVVTRQRQPLSGATVRFTPEPFLDGAVLPAVATTDQNGEAAPSIAAEDLPTNLQKEKLMQPGIYRVEIEHPAVSAKNSKPLGVEVDPSRRDGTTVRLDL